jgi:hypothetical protein
MRRLDELHLQHPVYGRPRLTALLQREGLRVNAKRVWSTTIIPFFGDKYSLPVARG